MFVEVGEGGRFDADRISPVGDPIEVPSKDLFLRELVLDLEREARLEKFLLPRAACEGSAIRVEVLCDLHGDRAAALAQAPSLRVLDRCRHESTPVDAVVFPETFVLDRDRSVAKILRNLLETDGSAVGL